MAGPTLGELQAEAERLAREVETANAALERARDTARQLSEEAQARLGTAQAQAEAAAAARAEASARSTEAASETDAAAAAAKRALSEAATERAAEAEIAQQDALRAADEARTRLEDVKSQESAAAAALQEAQRLSAAADDALRAAQPGTRAGSPSPSGTGAPRGVNATSAVLLFSALVIGWLAISLFYATQLHLRISEMKLNGVSMNIWRTSQFNKRIGSWDDRLEEARGKLIDLRRREDGAERSAAAANNLKINEEEVFRRRINMALANLALPPMDPADDVELKYFQTLSALREKKAAGGDNVGNWEKLIDSIEKSSVEYYARARAARNGDAEFAIAKMEVTNAEKIGRGVEAEAARLFGLSTVEVPADFVEQIRNVISEVNANSSPNPLMNNFFMLWPTENLVLLLVVVMGVLGSCLHLMADHFGLSGDRSADDPGSKGGVRWPQALLRMFYGGVTALVVYLIAKASVPIVADTSRIGGQAPLNPYFISFVGIISGLVSDRALRSLRRIGEGVFAAGGPVDTTPRYATPALTTKLEEIAGSIEKLATYLNLNPGDTKDAVEGRRALTPHEQAVIAAFANADQREAFSDLRPVTA